MRKLLLWSGYLLGAVGIAVIVAAAVMIYMGLSPSFNLGDPARFEFVLVPFWQIGVGLAVLGGLCVLAGRRMA